MSEFFGMDRRGAGRTKRTNDIVLGSRGRAPKITRRVLDGGDGGDINTGSGSCGCCDPSNCADYPIPTDGCDTCDASAKDWLVNFGSMLSNGDSSFDTTQRLEYVSYCVWRSASFMSAAVNARGGCNEGACDCTGDVIWQSTGSAWSQVSNDCSAGCYNPSEPSCDATTFDAGTQIRMPCYGDDFDTYNSGTTQGGATLWGRTGGSCANSNQPSRNAECTGESVKVPCCASDAELNEIVYAYVELSLSNTRDSENRNQTTLTLYVGDIAAIVWQMPIGKDWCCLCENKMELKCCGPYEWGNVPETVCVTPSDLNLDDIYVDVPEGWDNCCTPFMVNGVPKLPRYLILEIALGTDSCADQCCAAGSGSFICEWDGISKWVYNFLGAGCLDGNICDDGDGCLGEQYDTLSRWEIGCDTHRFAAYLSAFDWSWVDPLPPGCDQPCGDRPGGCIESSSYVAVGVVTGTISSCFTPAALTTDLNISPPNACAFSSGSITPITG